MPTMIESSEGKLTFGTGYPTVIGSMLVNTMKVDALIAELRHGKLDGVKRVAEQQRLLGVGLLNVMISHPEIDEKVFFGRRSAWLHPIHPACPSSSILQMLKR